MRRGGGDVSCISSSLSQVNEKSGRCFKAHGLDKLRIWEGHVINVRGCLLHFGNCTLWKRNRLCDHSMPRFVFVEPGLTRALESWWIHHQSNRRVRTRKNCVSFTLVLERNWPVRELQCVEVPASRRERVGQPVDVEVFGADTQHTDLGLPEDENALDLAQPTTQWKRIKSLTNVFAEEKHVMFCVSTFLRKLEGGWRKT